MPAKRSHRSRTDAADRESHITLSPHLSSFCWNVRLLFCSYASEAGRRPTPRRSTAQYSAALRPAPTNQENGEIALNAGTRATMTATAAEIAKTRTARRLMPPWYQYGEDGPSW